MDNCKSETELWHACLGHLNANYMYQMCKSECVIGLKCDNSIDLSKCETCLAGKIASTPCTKTQTRSTELLEIIHVDVCDPMRCNSLGAVRYFISLIDDRSRWCIVQFMRTKADVFDKFKEFKNLVENQTGHKIKALQSDSGSKFFNEKMNEFLKAAGIKRHLTVPHTPQQNGVDRNQLDVFLSRWDYLHRSGLKPWPPPTTSGTGVSQNHCQREPRMKSGSASIRAFLTCTYSGRKYIY